MHKFTLALFSILVAASLLLTACGSSTPAADTVSTNGAAIDNLNGNITISGAFALYPMMTLWADEFKNCIPKSPSTFQLAVQAKA